MGADVDFTVTPRPVYYSDGRKEPDCYTYPPSLHDELTDRLGPFPLFTYWGPNAGMPSSQWILGAARQLFDEHRPDLSLVYLPHLDYEPQRSGPDSPETVRAARQLDAAIRPLIDHLLASGATVVALSEYGIAPADRPVDINRALREAAFSRPTPRTAWSTWTRGPRVPSPSPTTRSPMCTSAIRPISRRPPRSSRASTESPNSSAGTASRRTAWTTSGPVSSSRSPIPVPGSRTTTGLTTIEPPTSPGRSRSTASPVTTRPNCCTTRRSLR